MRLGKTPHYHWSAERGLFRSGACFPPKYLQFPNAVVLNAVVRRKSAKKASPQKSAKERKRAQKSAKERFRVKIANNQVENNQAWELPKIIISWFSLLLQTLEFIVGI